MNQATQKYDTILPHPFDVLSSLHTNMVDLHVQLMNVKKDAERFDRITEPQDAEAGAMLWHLQKYLESLEIFDSHHLDITQMVEDVKDEMGVMKK